MNNSQKASAKIRRESDPRSFYLTTPTPLCYNYTVRKNLAKEVKMARRKLTTEEKLKKERKESKDLRTRLTTLNKVHDDTYKELTNTRIALKVAEDKAVDLNAEKESFEKQAEDLREWGQKLGEENQALKQENGSLAREKAIVEEKNNFLNKMMDTISALVLER
jgi:chromosome segregation ATPase